MHERKRKLFVGIELDDESRRACAAASERLRKTGFAAKYEPPEKLHVTLAFLGYVEPARVEDIVTSLATAANCSPFGVTLDKLGAFPHERRPRVVFVGAREQGAPFRALAGSVREVYAGLGFEFRDDAVAHVTIARVKGGRGSLPSIEFAPVPLRIERVTLFESLPDREHRTTRYEALETAALRA